VTKLVPPSSLQEIFQISNSNRKMNKQRKKCKLELLEDFDYKSNKSYGPTSPAPSPPQNAYQLVQLMYKQDAAESRGSAKQLTSYNQSLRAMNDAQFMKHLGWLKNSRQC